MWSVPAKNKKKINMSISFVYDVSIQDNCENAVFTFLPFYKQNITFSTIKEYSMGTTQPIRNKRNTHINLFHIFSRHTPHVPASSLLWKKQKCSYKNKT